MVIARVAGLLGAGVVIAILAVASMPHNARAQSADGTGVGGIADGGQGFGGGRKHQHQKADDKAAAEQKPKVDEKAYAAALKALPDKKSDPWNGMR